MASKMFSNPTQSVRTILILFCLIGMVFVQAVGFSFADELMTNLINTTLVRLFGGLAFLFLLMSFGYRFLRPLQKPFYTILLVTLPAWIVALNNLPWIAWIKGQVTFTEPLWMTGLFTLDVLSVGLFEEIVFRGVILVVFIQRLGSDKRGRFLAVFLSAGIFSIVHLFNLFAGAAVGDTLLQMSYSFGMGLMWGVVFLATGSIWSAVILHATYNFTGLLFVTLGTVYGRYDAITIVLTTLFAVIAAVYYWVVLERLNPLVLEEMVTPKD